MVDVNYDVIEEGDHQSLHSRFHTAATRNGVAVRTFLGWVEVNFPSPLTKPCEFKCTFTPVGETLPVDYIKTGMGEYSPNFRMWFGQELAPNTDVLFYTKKTVNADHVVSSLRYKIFEAFDPIYKDPVP